MSHQQEHGTYDDNEEGNMNHLTLSLLIGRVVQAIEQPL
jgi:hypothetical protein